jgi:hypothetical protein
MSQSQISNFRIQLLLVFIRIIVVLKRFVKNTFRLYLFPRLLFSKQELGFVEGNKFTTRTVFPNLSLRAPVILLYNSVYGGAIYQDHKQLPKKCEITTDRNRFTQAAAVVFHLPTLGNISFLKKQPGQLWVASTMECEVHFPRWSNKRFMNKFDMKMSYYQDANIFIPYVYPQYKTSLRVVHSPKVKKNLITFFASNYDEKSGRTKFVAELIKYIDVHSYGRCLRNRRLPQTQNNYQGKLDTLTRYKFDLAFENAVAKDYVTEKFFDPLRVGCVPVYLGTPNIDDFAPGAHCFINVSDFQSPKQLAEYLLWLNNNDEEYQKYFSWKQQPFRDSFLRILEKVKVPSLIQLENIILNKIE